MSFKSRAPFRCLYPLAALLASFLLPAAAQAQAQGQTADRIIAVVGKNRIILESELAMNLAQYRNENPEAGDSAKCTLLQEMIFQKILVEQAERDSVMISDEEVEANMENRLRQFIARAGGSKERLEQQMGKTIYQMKDDNRDAIKEMMVADKMRNQLLSSVKITPAEVKKYFDKAALDTLPYFPATVEIGQIVVDPPVSPEMDNYARTKLEDIRKQVMDKEASFETMAGIWSTDPGSRDNGGDLGMVTRGEMVPEFSNAAFKLQTGEISQIVKTKFGYHIIQLLGRQGDQAHLRHILIRPERTSSDFKAAMAKLDSVRAELIAGKVSFQIAVGKYSTDEMSKVTGGMINSRYTGSSRLQIEELDPEMVLGIDSLQAGAFSHPQIFTDMQTGDKSCRIIYLRSRTQPHKANLTDDYGAIQDVALKQKQTEKMNKWLADKLPSYYLKIDRDYQACPELAPWLTTNNKGK
jgi:peptidyl-prolyl cis-trans isomerase SurA